MTAISRTGPAYTRAELVADTTIHIVGVISALLAVPVLVTLAAVWSEQGALVAAVAVYGASVLAMLGFSAGYNLAHVRRRGGRLVEVLRRLDHAAIYVKIAGTYTPYAVIAGGALGRWLLVGVWSGALVGLVVKVVAPERFEKLSILLYLGLGWIIAATAGPFVEVLATGTFVLIFVGGGLYTVGIVFHLWQRLPFQNAIWHVFVLLATFVFYAACIVQVAQYA